MNTPVMDALVEFVLDLELASLPADVVAGAQRSVTDWFGTAIRGSVEPLAVAIGKVIDATGGEPQATVIARRQKTSALFAAMAREYRKQLGAKHVCNSSAAAFKEELTDAVAAMGATVAFGAIGGGTLAGSHGDGATTMLQLPIRTYGRPDGAALHATLLLSAVSITVFGDLKDVERDRAEGVVMLPLALAGPAPCAFASA